MKYLIVGLGNVGEEYEGTRLNRLSDNSNLIPSVLHVFLSDFSKRLSHEKVNGLKVFKMDLV